MQCDGGDVHDNETEDHLILTMDACVSLTLEQQELCRIRLKLLQFIDRLLTYQVCFFIYSNKVF